MSQTLVTLTYVVVLLFVLCSYIGQCADDECEVCIKYLTKIKTILDDENIEGEPAVRRRLKEECRKAKGKDNRFCYYIGGTDDAATGLIGEVSKPLSFHMPADKICQKLKKKDSQICELRYEKQIDWKNVDLNKMRVKQLKKILMDWGEECKGCLEKQEYVKRVKELMPTYAHQEL